MDRFGRVTDLLWRDYGSSTDAVRIKHGYDRAGNRLWRVAPVAASYGKNFDEFYTYDGTAGRIRSGLGRSRLSLPVAGPAPRQRERQHAGRCRRRGVHLGDLRSRKLLVAGRAGRRRSRLARSAGASQGNASPLEYANLSRGWRKRLAQRPRPAEEAAGFRPVRLVSSAGVAVQLPGGTQLHVPTSDRRALRLVIDTLARVDAQRAGGGSC